MICFLIVYNEMWQNLHLYKSVFFLLLMYDTRKLWMNKRFMHCATDFSVTDAKRLLIRFQILHCN